MALENGSNLDLARGYAGWGLTPSEISCSQFKRGPGSGFVAAQIWKSVGVPVATLVGKEYQTTITLGAILT